MRDIIFRGQWTANHAWQFGYLISDFKANENFSIVNETGKYRVAHKTISQYTGLTDKNGEKIFEGDIIAFTNNDGCRSLYLVDWRASRWVIRYLPNVPCFDDMEDWNPKYWEVIGNKWDNPELLKEGA